MQCAWRGRPTTKFSLHVLPAAATPSQAPELSCVCITSEFGNSHWQQASRRGQRVAALSATGLRLTAG
jgi:hypothetical protein